MKAFLWALVIVLIAGGAYWLWQSNALTPAGSDANSTGSVDDVSDTDNGGIDVNVGADVSAPTSASVTYNGSNFSPSSVILKKGGTVTWTNSGSGGMWVASAIHPSHEVYSGTSREEHCPDTAKVAFDQCAGGNSYSFTFDKAGTWNYHDHLKSSVFGRVEVVE